MEQAAKNVEEEKEQAAPQKNGDFAIIKSKGKQYRVKQDDFVDVDILPMQKGEDVEFNEVLFVQKSEEAIVGTPLIEGYSVKGVVVDEVVGPKISTLKYKPKGHSSTRFGHRQHYTRVHITEIKTQ